MVCNSCNATIPDAAKFCPKCGNKIEQAEQQQQAGGNKDETIPREIPAAAPGPKTSGPFPSETTGQQPGKGGLLKVAGIVIVLCVVLLGSVGAYFALTYFLRADPQKMQEGINAELQGRGLNLTVEVGKDWQAAIRGTAKNRVDKETALSIVKAHKEIKEVRDEISVQADAAETAASVNAALKQGGISEIQAQTDQNNAVILRGTAKDEQEKENALRIARETGKTESIKDEIQLMPAGKDRRRDADLPQPKPRQSYQTKKQDARPGAATRFRDEEPGDTPRTGMGAFRLEEEINRALKNAGIRTVTVMVNANMAAVVKGSAYSLEEKDRALRVVESFPEVRRVHDRISVER